MTLTIESEIFQTLPDKPLLRVDEVATFFSIHKKTVYTWYALEKLTGCNVAGVLRIYRQSVVDLVISTNGKKNGVEDSADIDAKMQTPKKKHLVKPRGKGWVKNW